MDLSFLPAVNASLNGLACVCLTTGLVMIKKGRVEAHRTFMLLATTLSSLFLISYCIHYFWRLNAKGGLHTQFNGDDFLRTLYYTMLLTHITLAITVPFWITILIRLAVTRRFAQHRRLARIAFPIWMYVSLTGVLIYFMLYWFNSPPPSA